MRSMEAVFPPKHNNKCRKKKTMASPLFFCNGSLSVENSPPPTHPCLVCPTTAAAPTRRKKKDRRRDDTRARRALACAAIFLISWDRPSAVESCYFGDVCWPKIMGNDTYIFVVTYHISLHTFFSVETKIRRRTCSHLVRHEMKVGGRRRCFILSVVNRSRQLPSHCICRNAKRFHPITVRQQ